MITGKLVGLRAIEKSDLSLLQAWRNLPQFRKNFREFKELSLANQEAWFQRIVVDSQNDFMFIVERLSDKKPIGVGGLVYVNWINRSADFSFYIGEEEKYISEDEETIEAVKLLLDYGFKAINMHKVWMELYDYDLKKISFFTNQFSFLCDGLLRDNCFEDGKYSNSHIYSLLEDEYKK